MRRGGTDSSEPGLPAKRCRLASPSVPEKSIGGKTFSLCPECLDKVPARVVRSGGRIFLDKHCSLHGASRSLAENDAEFYLAARHTAAAAGGLRPNRLVLITTYRCNLNCPLCYVPHRDPTLDFTPAELALLLGRVQTPEVYFAGGEPTVMAGLPALIRTAKRFGRFPILVSNGLRLADEKFVAELAGEGLVSVILSFNAMNPQVMKVTDGDDLVAAKLQAIENLARYGITFFTSFSLVRGVNEDDLAEVFRFTVGDTPHARGFLLENLPAVGRSLAERPVFMSQILARFASCVGGSRAGLVNMARQGQARLTPYSFEMDLPVGMVKRRPSRGGRAFMVRLQAGPTAASADSGQTAAFVDRTLCASKLAPLMPLWLYFLRVHGRARQIKTEPPLAMGERNASFSGQR